jgi:uncharacterized membrane-anchored protein YhcB (DUF1043 family)
MMLWIDIGAAFLIGLMVGMFAVALCVMASDRW